MAPQLVICVGKISTYQDRPGFHRRLGIYADTLLLSCALLHIACSPPMQDPLKEKEIANVEAAEIPTLETSGSQPRIDDKLTQSVDNLSTANTGKSNISTDTTPAHETKNAPKTSTDENAQATPATSNTQDSKFDSDVVKGKKVKTKAKNNFTPKKGNRNSLSKYHDLRGLTKAQVRAVKGKPTKATSKRWYYQKPQDVCSNSIITKVVIFSEGVVVDVITERKFQYSSDYCD